MTPEPKDPVYESRVRASFGKQKLMRTIGAVLEDVSPGVVSIRLPFADHLTQQHGFIHAGAIAAIADSACGYAALSLMPADAGVLSIEFKVNMLSPATGDSVVARATVIRAGRTSMVKLVAAMQGTMMVVTGRDLTD
jgi:uncharacterized protein (TIGR00369 family)